MVVGNTNKIEHVYIHVPFCKRICSYCDFCKMFYNDSLASRYLESLEKEFKSFNLSKVKTIYIGGGTPSVLNRNNLIKLFNIIKDIELYSDYEFTFEMNPDDITEDLLIFLKNNRVNRISIGIETINEKFYEFLNRYNDSTLTSKIELVKKYFDTINLDLMYAFPDETIDDLKKDLDYVTSFNIDHISIYSLIIEEHTVLKNKNIKPIDSDIDNEMYYFIIKYLKDKGYNHYEISNFSKDNKESIHNLCYWNNQQYLGIGLGASGYINNIRYTNTRSINNYLNGKYILEKEIIDKRIEMEYELILGLRKIKGISKTEFFNKFNVQVSDEFDIIELVDNKLLIENDDYIYIPEDKLYISNNILINFIGD